MNQIPQPELANTMPQSVGPAAGKPRDPSWPESRRRPRVPQVYGIVHCIKRSLGIMLDLGGIVMCIMYAAKYPPRVGSGIVPTIGVMTTHTQFFLSFLSYQAILKHTNSLFSGFYCFGNRSRGGDRHSERVQTNSKSTPRPYFFHRLYRHDTLFSWLSYAISLRFRRVV